MHLPGFSGRARCEKDHAYGRKWRSKRCDCLEHITSRDWFIASGDSYVVKVKEMEGSGFAASYLAKYFTKDFLFADDRKSLGFSRAWSRSRNWPGEDMQLKATQDERWGKVSFVPGEAVESGAISIGRLEWWLERSKRSPLMERVGTDLAFELGVRKEHRRVVGAMRRSKELLNASSA